MAKYQITFADNSKSIDVLNAGDIEPALVKKLGGAVHLEHVDGAYQFWRVGEHAPRLENKGRGETEIKSLGSVLFVR